MSSHNPQLAIASPSKRRRRGFQAFKSSDVKSDWVTTSLMTAKIIMAGAESLPFPYTKDIFRTTVILLETIEKVEKNRDDLKELAEDIMEILTMIQELSFQPEIPAVKFKSRCEEFGVVFSLQSWKCKPNQEGSVAS
ncbi:hypothetical protein C8R44DRAFT_747597 [Mycena epipterygia]|nr:hypothetical protein C8R44DRAFT_747597 [Mycena epipterygia]